MHFTTCFTVALAAFATAPAAIAYPLGYENDFDTRALVEDSEEAIMARQLGEVIFGALHERGLVGEDAQAVEARFFPFIGMALRPLLGKVVKSGAKSAAKKSVSENDKKDEKKKN
ncbi:hypothetical protein Hypma_013515 [Hypsizygus marmoreus]|uniref:Uncharacterized protein n=1 Tax=Hypsizygus marmoreus TaxID=39966 RepID=A0A369JF88_HYPMA|nr:hypothetical protein Hypma_013515 [Hypsizygus marmoreus]